nr:DUF397 domain-containing protein [Saccharopolyspora gloriosae]
MLPLRKVLAGGLPRDRRTGGGECAEGGDLPAGAAVRDSKDRAAGHFAVDRPQWSNRLVAIERGDFEHCTRARLPLHEVRRSWFVRSMRSSGRSPCRGPAPLTAKSRARTPVSGAGAAFRQVQRGVSGVLGSPPTRPRAARP